MSNGAELNLSADKRRILYISDDNQTEDGSVPSPMSSRQASPVHFKLMAECDEDNGDQESAHRTEDDVATTSKDHPPSFAASNSHVSGSIYYSSPNEPLRQQHDRKLSSAETTPPSIRTTASPSAAVPHNTTHELWTTTSSTHGLVGSLWQRLAQFIPLSLPRSGSGSYTTLMPYDRAQCLRLLEVATSYEQWQAAAEALDQMDGKQAWKSDPYSTDYDYGLLSERLQQLQLAREKGDIPTMIFLLRTSLSRNLADMGNSALYAESRIGTKKLIEDYIDEVVRHFDILCDTTSSELTLDDKLELFLNIRQSFGRTALLLSGGATMGLNHLGVIRALHQAQLLPRIICGSSIGSMVAAFVCCRNDQELAVMSQEMNLNLNALERPEEEGSLFHKISRFLKHGTFLDVEVLKENIRENIGDITFQESYNRTRRILNITVSSSTKYEMPRLLNYLTAPNVLIWSAVAASCAIPLVYKSAPLMARDKQGNIVPWNPSGHRFVDGSLDNDIPTLRLTELFNVNHFIVSQVNPHVVPFLSRDFRNTRSKRMMNTVLNLARTELVHRLDQLIELDIFPTLLHKTRQIFSQRYGGDITIVPEIKLQDYVSLLSNPSQETLWDALIRGERATWKLISIIKNHCQIELALDRIVYRIRIRRLEHNAPPFAAVTFDEGGFPLQPTLTHSMGDIPALHARERSPTGTEWAGHHRSLKPELGLTRSKSFGHTGGHDKGGIMAKHPVGSKGNTEGLVDRRKPATSGVPRRVKSALKMTIMSESNPAASTVSSSSESSSEMTMPPHSA